MAKDPEFGKEYCEIIQSYIDKGFARKLSDEKSSKTSDKTFYLPHFGVKIPITT